MAAVWTVLIVEAHIGIDLYVRVDQRAVRLKIDFLVFDRAPKAFDGEWGR